MRRHYDADGDGWMARCPLPGSAHRGAAFFGVDDLGGLRLFCECQACWRPLADLRAAEGYGRDRFAGAAGGPATAIERAVWSLRLAYDLGGVAPLEVALPRPPAAAPRSVHEVWAALRLLFGLRWQDGPRVPVPFAEPFGVAWWPGLTRSAVRHGLRILRGSGSVHVAETRVAVLRDGGGREWVPLADARAGRAPAGADRMRLWLPGRPGSGRGAGDA